jgi:tRNA G10  N-methylase Trm11
MDPGKPKAIGTSLSWTIGRIPLLREMRTNFNQIGKGSRELMTTYDLKQRQYVGNTSFDAELSLVTANQALVHSPIGLSD